jgi:hypothetical protein
MKVYILTYETTPPYSDGRTYSGIEGVYSSRDRALQVKAEREAFQKKYKMNDTYYTLDGHEVEE